MHIAASKGLAVESMQASILPFHYLKPAFKECNGVKLVYKVHINAPKRYRSKIDESIDVTFSLSQACI